MNEIMDLFLNPEDAATLRKSESMFLNVDEAKNFISSRDSPIDREVLWLGFATLTFRMAQVELAGKFDVLFFTRILSEMLKDRDHLRKVLCDDLPGDQRQEGHALERQVSVPPIACAHEQPDADV